MQIINLALDDLFDVRDRDIEELLTTVYVGEGHTTTARAEHMFAAQAVRDRGELIVAQIRGDEATLAPLAGMIILVTPGHPGHQWGTDDEAELHLLAVDPSFRQRGVGRCLVDHAIRRAASLGFRQAILWTQPRMQAAHRLYHRMGFQRQVNRDFVRDDQPFWMLSRPLAQ